FAQAGWNIEDHARSVLTGRTQQEIAADLPPVKAPAKKKSSSVKTKKKILDPSELDGAVASPIPESITPMSAYLADHPPSGDQWLYEIKWDGVRAVCFIRDQKVEIFSRTGNRCDRQYPELAVLPHFIDADTAIVDAEIAVLDEDGKAAFELIQPRISVSD